MTSTMTARQQLVDWLRPQAAPHITPDFLNPAFEFHVSYDMEHARPFLPVDYDGERRHDAARDYKLDAPLEFATIGSNFVDDDGYCHVIGCDIDGKDHAEGHDDAAL